MTGAAWHLFTDSALLARHRPAQEPERPALLHAIPRLEPAIAMLRRRTTEPLPLPGGSTGGTPVALPAGAVVELLVDRANADARAVGRDTDRVRPGRARHCAAASYRLSFGDGADRCPGADVAMQETDVFLTRLFAGPGVRLRTRSRVDAKASLHSYGLRDAVVAIGRTVRDAEGD